MAPACPDRVAVATLEERMDDLRAVMDDAGSQRAAVFGSSKGGALSVLFTATYPDRVSALVLYGAYPRMAWAPDYPDGIRVRCAQAICEEVQSLGIEVRAGLHKGEIELRNDGGRGGS